MLRTRTTRRAARVCALLALTAAAATTAGTASAANRATAVRAATTSTAAVTTARVDVVAVTGTDRVLYARATDDSGFTKLGGQLTSAPVLAVADGDNDGVGDNYFVGVGSDHNLWIRTFDLNWRPLGPSSTHCADPSIAVNGTTLAVACRGSDDKLYVGKATVSSDKASSLPRVSRWSSKGGKMLYGTTVGVDDAALNSFYYQVVGTDHLIWETSDTASFAVVPGSPSCYGALGQDAITEDGAACRASDGALQVLSNQDGAFHKIPSGVKGRPGVAVDDDGTTRYYVIGTDNTIWVATQSASGSLGSFHLSSGRGKYGISAASVSGA